MTSKATSAERLPASCSLTPRQHADTVYLLTNTGSFTTADANTYAAGWRCRPAPDLVLGEAIRYDDLGLTADQGVAWHQAGFYAAETAAWLAAGYTPSQAAELTLLASFTDLDAWLDSGLPARQVITLVRAGVSPWEAQEVLSDPSMTPETLPMMTALLGR